MLSGFVLPRFNVQKNILRDLIVYTLTICLIFNVFMLGLHTLESPKVKNIAVPLLLNSDSVNIKNAEVSVILWAENSDTAENFLKQKPLPGWQWTCKELTTAGGLQAISISGHKVVDKKEERNLYTWYTNMAQKLDKKDCQIYLDERVPQAIDVCSYLSEENASPRQWSLSSNLISVAAYMGDVPISVMAGQDRLNIQVLSRGNNSEGQTVLAIPALLEEF